MDRFPLLAALLTAVLVSLALTLLRELGALQALDLALYDAYRSQASGPRSEQVVLVEITEEDIRWLGDWPMNDQDLALVLDRLGDAGARAIGVDLYRDLAVPPGSALLSAQLRSDPRIIAVWKLGGDGATGVRPPAVLAATDRIGFNDFVLDPDGCARRGLLYAETDEGETATSFGLRLALEYLSAVGVAPAPDPDLPERLRLGATSIPWLERDAGGYVGADAAGYQILLDLRAGPGGFDVLRFSEVMSDGFDRERVREKIVLIGSAAESVPDLFHVCLLAGGAIGARIPGVELHAHVVDQLLRFALGSTPALRVAGESTEVGLIAVCSALGAALGLLRRGASLSLLLIAGGLLAILGAGLQAYRAAVWLPLAGPALGWLCGAGGVITWISGSERRQRALLMRLFARHQSPAIAGELWAQRRQFLEGGRLRPRRLVATILFMDMKGSTAISEHLDPEDLMEFINGFMSTMAELVAEHGGYVDDYFGDGLKADFGVPIPRSSDAEIRGDAQNAVRCALAAADALTGINARHRSRGWPPVAMRIGIHTGEVVSGSLGSDEKLKFTVVGDVVVAAARLESLDGVEHDFESRPARILASEQTVERLGGEFETESLGAHALRGRSQSLRVHRVLGPRK